MLSLLLNVFWLYRGLSEAVSYHAYRYAKLMLVSVFFIPIPVFAGMEITEIMFDVPGTDDGREWIEIKNTGNEKIVIDTSTWKFFENNTNHGLTLFSGNGEVEAGSCAIIADNPDKFLTDWPGWGGTIFDSSFSLSNTGETIALKSDASTIADTVSYSATGATGDGNSLQKIQNNWQSQPATPGCATGIPVSVPEPVVQTTSESSPPSNPTSTGNPEAAKPHIFAQAPPDMTAVAGADVAFRGKAYGLQKEPIQNARFVWNFGDGGTAESMSVFHLYRYPGTYIVTLDVASGEWSAEDRLTVTVIPSPLKLGTVEKGESGFVEIVNTSLNTIDISNWIISDRQNYFSMPGNTIIAGNAKIVFANEVTKLTISEPDSVILAYPNGVIAAEYIPPKPIPRLVPASSKVSAPEQVSPEEKIMPENPTEVPIFPSENPPKEGARIALPAAAVTSLKDRVLKSDSAETKNERKVLWPWFAVGGLAVISAGALVFSRGKGEEFTIIDVSEPEEKP